MEFPVFSRAIQAKGTVKAGLPAIARQVADVAASREANESEKRTGLAAGELGLDIYKMRGPLERVGLMYIALEVRLGIYQNPRLARLVRQPKPSALHTATRRG